MTESDKTLIIRLWNGGVPVKKIPYMLPYRHGEGAAMVAALRADGTLSERTRENKEQLVAAAYESGMTDLEELAENYGLTPKTVRVYLHRCGIKRGVPKKYKGHKPCAKTVEILREMESGKTQSEIARQFGVSRQYVAILKKRLENAE